MNELIEDLKVKIITALNLPDVQPADIGPDEQLVGGRLGIDSIDVLELVIMLEKDYGITIDNKEVGAQVFASLNTMARYIIDNSSEFPN
ncbi:MAG: phosphopantetheine-binding protein [Desulfobacteraceae bacterium]|jgi:acyl carrier protein